MKKSSQQSDDEAEEVEILELMAAGLSNRESPNACLCQRTIIDNLPQVA